MEASQAAELGKENAFTLKDCFKSRVFFCYFALIKSSVHGPAVTNQ